MYMIKCCIAISENNIDNNKIANLNANLYSKLLEKYWKSLIEKCLIEEKIDLIVIVH